VGGLAKKSVKSPPRCISASCSCPTDDSESHYADFSTKTNPDIYDTYFDIFLHYSFGDFSSEGENQHRHIYDGTPTKRQISKRRVSKRLVSKRLKRQVYKTSGLQNVRFTKRQVYKTSGLQNVRLQKKIHLYSVLAVGGNPQVLLQPCVAGKVMAVFFFLYFRGYFCHISP
jgi:hypothetical protein